MTRIVVGVDGSGNSQRALQRAIAEAKLRGGTVDAVFTYEPPGSSLSDDLVGLARSAAAPLGASSADGPAQADGSDEQGAQQEAERRLGAFVEGVPTDGDGPQPKLLAIPNKHPAAALIEESKTADLLVVGTRGIGGLKGMLLGSVAHQCIQHSHCPVLVIPAEHN